MGTKPFNLTFSRITWGHVKNLAPTSWATLTSIRYFKQVKYIILNNYKVGAIKLWNRKKVGMGLCMLQRAQLLCSMCIGLFKTVSYSTQHSRGGVFSRNKYPSPLLKIIWSYLYLFKSSIPWIWKDEKILGKKYQRIKIAVWCQVLNVYPTCVDSL